MLNRLITWTCCCATLAAFVACRPAQTRPARPGAATRIAGEYDVQTARGPIRVRLVEVSYAVGDSSTPHSHDCPVVAHVIDGALRSGLNQQPESVYSAGQGFYEPAKSQHRVSGNASSAKATRFLAVFLCESAGGG